MSLGADDEGKLAFQQSCQSSKSFGEVMDLLDECWFFRNTLVDRNIKIVASCQEKDQKVVTISSTGAAGSDQRDEYFLSTESEFSNNTYRGRSRAVLIRSPTVLLAAVPQLKLLEEDEEAALALNSSYPKLRHSMSALEYASASKSSSSSSRKKTSLHNLSCSGGGERLEEKTERYRAILHYIARENYYRKTFTQKKWRSLCDLEYMEVQGLRDLGFVFQKEGSTGTGIINHAAAPPGQSINHNHNPYPYVSDMYTCFHSKSTQDMKDQLRFWAKAVASNTRHQF